MLNKKICCLFLAAVMCLTGCRRSERPSAENRYKDHKYDFADYMEVYTVGVDGNGFLYIEPKDITRDMFENDDEFIKVKKDLDEIDLYYTPTDTKGSRYLALSKTENLSNGDVIDIGIAYNERDLRSDMNISTYPYTVTGLKDASEDVYIDPFDEEFVLFYGTEDEGNLYSMEIPENRLTDVLEPLVYDVSTDEYKILENGTLIDVELKRRNSNDKNVSNNLMLYFAKNGYVLEKTYDELILSYVARPIDFENLSDTEYETLEQALKNAVASYLEKGNIKIFSIQRNGDYEEDERPYSYVITYSYFKDGATAYGESGVTVHKVGDKFNVLSVTNSRNIKAADVNASTKNTILHVFNNE